MDLFYQKINLVFSYITLKYNFYVRSSYKESWGKLKIMFERETVLNERTFGFKCGFSKDVLLMVGKAFRRLQGKGMRKGKATGARGALPERYSTAR